MKKNEHKKKDANGNELAEEIGKGFNDEHYKKVLAERILNDIYTFKISELLKDDYKKVGGTAGMLRAFMQAYVSQKKLMK